MYMETVGSHIGGRAVANAEKRIGGWGGRYGPGAATAASEASPFFLRAFLFLSLSLPRLFTQSLVRSHFLFPLSASHFLQRVPPPSHLVIPSTTQFSTHAPRFQPPPTPPGTAYLTPPPLLNRRRCRFHRLTLPLLSHPLLAASLPPPPPPLPPPASSPTPPNRTTYPALIKEQRSKELNRSSCVRSLALPFHLSSFQETLLLLVKLCFPHFVYIPTVHPVSRHVSTVVPLDLFLFSLFFFAKERRILFILISRFNLFICSIGSFRTKVFLLSPLHLFSPSLFSFPLCIKVQG